MDDPSDLKKLKDDIIDTIQYVLFFYLLMFQIQKKIFNFKIENNSII